MPNAVFGARNEKKCSLVPLHEQYTLNMGTKVDAAVGTCTTNHTQSSSWSYIHCVPQDIFYMNEYLPDGWETGLLLDKDMLCVLGYEKKRVWIHASTSRSASSNQS